MQRVNEYRFYELGAKIGAILKVNEKSTYETFWWPLWEARDALRSLAQDAVAVRVSLPIVRRVIAAIDEIVPQDISGALQKQTSLKQPGANNLIGFGYYELQEALKAFEPVLAAECNALDTYVISQKRGYSTPDLVDRCEVMLPLETIMLLESNTVADIRAAGRCLAFDTPTAAGFHILRAVESVMALYYTHVSGKDLVKRNRNWGAYLKALEGVSTADEKVKGALSHIKDNYRNPITHPEDTLTEGQAIMLFGLCLSVIELMAEQMRTTAPTLTGLQQVQALSQIAEQEAAAGPDDF